MKGALAAVGAFLAGAIIGGVLTLTLQGTTAQESSVPPPTAKLTPATAVTTVPVPAPPPPPVTSAPPPPAATAPSPLSDEVLVVWTPGSLPDGFATDVEGLAGVTAVSSVRSDLVHLVESRDEEGRVVDAPGDGFVIPLEAMAFDPATYISFLPKDQVDVFAGLAPGEALLSTTSARLRRLGAGGTLLLDDGGQLRVAAVVEDALVGGAELALALPEAKGSGLATERYVLIRHESGRKDIEQAVRQDLLAGVPVRVRGPGETPVLRHGDAVLPQAAIKERFGEFAYRPSGGLHFTIEPGWVEGNIVTEEVPVLGTITCHRAMMDTVRAVMTDLERSNLAFLIDPDGFAGCFDARYIAGGAGISRHAWGAALDLNLASNPQGVESAQDPRLVALMEVWGFTSGSEWLIPDPGHFEYVRPPKLEVSG